MLRDKRIRLLMQASLKRIADLPDVPSMIEYAKNDEDRALMQIFLAQEAVARPVAAPPGVPPDRVSALREAFTAAVQDPDFLKDAVQAKLDLTPTSGADVDSVVELIGKTPKSMADRLTAAIAPPK
jgi:tripartite-type tricarboxylate transporter receptor subunit TctC